MAPLAFLKAFSQDWLKFGVDDCKWYRKAHLSNAGQWRQCDMLVFWSSRTDAALLGCCVESRRLDSVSTRVTVHTLDNAARTPDPCAVPAPQDHWLVLSSDSWLHDHPQQSPLVCTQMLGGAWAAWLCYNQSLRSPLEPGGKLEAWCTLSILQHVAASYVGYGCKSASSLHKTAGRALSSCGLPAGWLRPGISPNTTAVAWWEQAVWWGSPYRQHASHFRVICNMLDCLEMPRGTVVSIFFFTDCHLSHEPICLPRVWCLTEKHYPQPEFISPLSYWITGDQVEYIMEITWLDEGGWRGRKE